MDKCFLWMLTRILYLDFIYLIIIFHIFREVSGRGSQHLQGFSCMTVGFTGAVNYTQCDISTLQDCAICLS